MTDTVDEPQAHEDIFGQQRWDILRDRARLVHEADPRIRTMVTAEIEIVSNAHADLVPLIDVWCPTINTVDGRGSHAKCTMNSNLNESGAVKKFSKNVSTIERGDYSQVETLWQYQACGSVGCGGEGCGVGKKDKHNKCLEGWPAFFVIDHAAVAGRIMQWADFAYNVSGELYWGVLGQYNRVRHAASPDPSLLWRDQWTNGANGDGNLYYPGAPEVIGGKTHIPVESLRLKCKQAQTLSVNLASSMSDGCVCARSWCK